MAATSSNDQRWKFLNKKHNLIEKKYKFINNSLFCSACTVTLSIMTTHSIKRHERGQKHINAVKLLNKCTNSDIPPTTLRQGQSEFFKELCDAFLAANIPLNKLNNKELQNFLQKWTGKIVPGSSTLRKTYVKKLLLLIKFVLNPTINFGRNGIKLYYNYQIITDVHPWSAKFFTMATVATFFLI